jgi:hypothetical protein
VGQLAWSGFELPLSEGQGQRGETRKTGEDFDLFRRRMPAFNGTELKLNNNLRLTTSILTGLAGLAERTRCHIEWLTSGKKLPSISILFH